MSRKMNRCLVLGAAVLLLAAGSPVIAEEGVARSGVDLWGTVAGMAQTTFESNPIPADFFCPGSQPFAGRIYLQGAPLATEPAGSLGSIDTVVRRLDDAVFDEKGVAFTRIQLMALSLVSTRPVETSCGAYDVSVHLDGEQPTTKMRIVRTSALGGTYAAPLSLNVKVVFTPASGDVKGRRELSHRVDLGAANNSVWAYTSHPRYEGTPRIDTDGDGTVDAPLPAASNFHAGLSPVASAATSASSSTTPSTSPSGPIIACPIGYCRYQSCHCNPDSDDPYEPGGDCSSSHLHCIWTCVYCGGGVGTL